MTQRTLLQRRSFLRSIAALGAASPFFTQKGLYAQALIETPAMTIGPYYPDRMPLDLDNDLLLINDNISPGSGTIVWLYGRVLTRANSPVRNALVEIWQADINGSYIHSQGGSNKDPNFQGYGKFLTGGNGEYLFRTVVPGLYPGRTRHIHLAVTAPGQSRFVTQVFRTGESGNASDSVLNGVTNAAQRASVIVDWAALSGSALGELSAKFDVILGFTPAETPTPTRPTLVASAPITDAATQQPTIAPGSWVTLTGNGLAPTTRSWTAADIQGAKLPEALDQVSVRIGNQAASVSYISPTQLNVLAPTTLGNGAATVSVTNSNGTSDLATVTVESASPAFFLFPQDYVAATRPDGSVINQDSPAVPGEIIILYGNGFGATNPAAPSGETIPSPRPLANPVKIRIDGQEATVNFAGLISPGLYQFNVVVPSVANGDHAVRAEVLGARNQKLARLRTRRA
jgi:protocatechuate 3,4-dioxygenase beta subunit